MQTVKVTFVEGSSISQAGPYAVRKLIVLNVLCRDVLQLMERIAVCVKENESVLLVGETGVGKTSIIQTLASTLNISLKVVNLSPTSDTDELLEG